MKTITIRKTQMKVLKLRLDSTSQYDALLIDMVTEHFEMEVPESPFQLEVWAPMVPRKRPLYSLLLVSEDRVLQEIKAR
jgi:hypothetical protein